MEAPTTSTLMDRLKVETRPQHDDAENSALEKALFSGQITQAAYIEFLAQRYLLHVEFDRLLGEARAQHPVIDDAVEDFMMQAPYAAEDLRHFGVDPSTLEPLPATQAAIDTFRRDAANAPLRLLGAHYVFEGSNNGGRFICKSIRRAFNLQGEAGTRFLDPYGEEQRPRWAAFREKVNAHKFTPEEEDLIVDAAKHAFSAIAAIDTETYQKAMAH